MDDAEAKNIISMDDSNYGLQQVEELHGLSSQADVNEVTTFVNHKAMPEAEEVEITTMINPGTNTLQIAEELDQQGDESSDKTIYEHDEAELTKETTLVDAKTMFGAEEVENTSSVDLVTDNTLQLDEVHQQADETGISLPSPEPSNKFNEPYAKTLSQHDEKEKLVPNDQHENIILIDHVDELGTVSSIQVLDEEMKESERNSIDTEMDEKLKKIEEHVLAIDTEISQLELQCRESKGRHADFIEVYKLMTESKLPVRSHREIRLFMKKADKAAQQFLSNALDLQFNIEARAKLKLTLQEERKELVEAQKLKMQQKHNQTVEKKRKAYCEEDGLCAAVQAKRMALDVATDP